MLSSDGSKWHRISVIFMVEISTYYFDGFVWKRGNFNADTLELRLLCTNLLML